MMAGRSGSQEREEQVSGRSSWCFTDDHAGCRYAACTCACHALAPAPAAAAETAPGAAAEVPAAPVAPVRARPVPAGAQAALGFPDGLDGSTDDVATVALSFRGQAYEVDLSAAHRAELAAALAPFVAAARVVGPARPGTAASAPHQPLG